MRSGYFWRFLCLTFAVLPSLTVTLPPAHEWCHSRVGKCRYNTRGYGTSTQQCVHGQVYSMSRIWDSWNSWVKRVNEHYNG